MNYLGHTTINTTTIAIAACTTKIFSHVSNTDIAIFAGTALLATLLLSPDLDLRRSSPCKNWGLLRILWLPYQALFRHRGWSHNLVVSSITRIGYLLILGILIVMSLNFVPAYLHGTGREAVSHSTTTLGTAFSYSYGKIISYREYFIAGCLGIVASDTCHIVVDKVF